MTASISVVPANEASWDLQAIFSTRGYASDCQCQRHKMRGKEWDSGSVPVEERAFWLREQTDCGHPESGTTSGLVAYLDGEPVGWCAVEPRTAYVRLGSTPWADRAEDKTDGRRLGRDLLSHSPGLPAPRRQPGTRPRRRRLRTSARRPSLRGLPDDHPARAGDHLG